MAPSLVVALDKQIVYLIIILQIYFCLVGTFILWGKSVMVYLKLYVFSKLPSDYQRDEVIISRQLLIDVRQAAMDTLLITYHKL